MNFDFIRKNDHKISHKKLFACIFFTIGIVIATVACFFSLFEKVSEVSLIEFLITAIFGTAVTLSGLNVVKPKKEKNNCVFINCKNIDRARRLNWLIFRSL